MDVKLQDKTSPFHTKFPQQTELVLLSYIEVLCVINGLKTAVNILQSKWTIIPEERFSTLFLLRILMGTRIGVPPKKKRHTNKKNLNTLTILEYPLRYCFVSLEILFCTTRNRRTSGCCSRIIKSLAKFRDVICELSNLRLQRR